MKLRIRKLGVLHRLLCMLQLVLHLAELHLVWHVASGLCCMACCFEEFQYLVALLPQLLLCRSHELREFVDRVIHFLIAQT